MRRCNLPFIFNAGTEVMSTDDLVGNMSVPIFLDLVTCSGTETELLSECNIFRGAVGLHGCSHSQDVAIRCKGKVTK